MHSRLKSTILKGLATVLVLNAALPAIPQGGAPKPDAKQGPLVPTGLHETAFDTLEGTVRVYLPDDMAAGDTISGTVIAEPKGRTEEERQKNADVLEGLVVEIGDQKVSPKQRKFSWEVPAVGVLALALLNKSGGKRGSQDVPILAGPPTPDPVGSGADWPLLGQNGRPVPINGPFDPKAPTEVMIGGQPVEVLAESPRKCVVAMPRSALGPQQIAVSENGKKLGEGTIGAIRVGLSAPRTSLMSGESTTLRVRVEGLLAFAGDRLEVYFDPAYVILDNRTPDIIQLGPSGGSSGSESLPMESFSLSAGTTLPSTSVPVKIILSQITPEGVFEATLPIRAKQAGGFSISGTFLGKRKK